MQKHFTPILLSACLALAIRMPCISAEIPPKLDPLQGKWSVAKTNQEGRSYSQTMEIKKDRLIFNLIGGDDQLRFVAKGAIKAEKLGPFDVLVISHLEAGRSPEDLKSVDDDRTLVYTLRDERLIIASNFDKERDTEKPSMDAYVRVEASKEAAAGSEGDEAKLLGTWKAEVTYGETKLDYGLRIARADGKLEATLISPRSGDHKCKSAAYKGGEVIIEIDREIQGNDVTLIYKGKLTAEGLSGTISAKGYEDQLGGQWKASK